MFSKFVQQSRLKAKLWGMGTKSDFKVRMGKKNYISKVLLFLQWEVQNLASFKKFQLQPIWTPPQYGLSSTLIQQRGQMPRVKKSQQDSQS